MDIKKTNQLLLNEYPLRTKFFNFYFAKKLTMHFFLPNFILLNEKGAVLAYNSLILNYKVLGL